MTAASRKILWISSELPDALEVELLALLPPAQVVSTQSVQEAGSYCRNASEAVIVFAHFSGPDQSILFVENLRQQHEFVPILIRDPFSGASEAFALAQLGLTRIFDNSFNATQIAVEIEIALEQAELSCSRKAQPQSCPEWRSGIIGEGDSMLQILEIVRLVASRRSTVLISGETGTGKEVVARAFHEASSRSGLPMVAVNCAAIPANLLEAELFGYVRGAFTGANQMRLGRFEQAHKSTLFLDEIGDLPLDLQAKLLRVLQERELQRLGSSETVKLDVRIVAASNLDLPARVRQGLFREDLFYRLNVVPIRMPALRERLEDIPALTRHFVSKICREEDLPQKTLSMTVLPKLAGYSWPGNVRQLENAVEMAVVMSGTRTTLTSADFRLPSSVSAAPTPESTTRPLALPDHGLNFDETVLQFERNILSQALRRTGGNKKLAADMLGLKRTTLSAKVRILETTTGCALA